MKNKLENSEQGKISGGVGGNPAVMTEEEKKELVDFAKRFNIKLGAFEYFYGLKNEPNKHVEKDEDKKASEL